MVGVRSLRLVHRLLSNSPQFASRAYWTHLFPKIVVPKTTLELQQTFKGAGSAGTMKSLLSTEKTQGSVGFAPRPGRSIHKTRRRSSKSFTAEVRIEVSAAGTASVVDGRRGRLTSSPPKKEKFRPTGVHSLECGSRTKLAQKFRQLASSLEKEPDHSLKALLEKIEASVREVRYRVHKAEQTALTSGFYGQPPRVTLEQI